MTTAYTSLLGLALPVTGELSGTWGDTVNTAITSLLDTAIAGTTSITVDADTTLSTTTGASNEARQAIILWNPASGTVTRNITAPAQSKLYTVINASGGTQSIVIRGAGPTTGVTIAKGESAQVAWNGSDFVKVGSSGGAATFTNLTVTGNLTVNSLTNTRVPYASTSGLLVDSANMVFNGTRLTVADLADSGLTSTRVVYSTTGGALTDSANLTFDGTNLTLGGGTANGVAYLNGSKVLTTGSALAYDGTTFSAPFTSLSGNGVVLTVDRTGTGGNDRINAQFSNSGTVRGGIGTIGGAAGIYFTQGTTEGMRLTTDGLGVTNNIFAGSGSTSASYTRFWNASGYSFIGVEGNTGGTIATGTTAYAAVMASSGTNLLQFAPSGTVAGTFIANGNFGLSTNNPQARLHVVGSTWVTSDSTLSGATADGLTTRFTGNVSYLQSVTVSSGTVTGGRDLSFDGNTLLFRTINGASFGEVGRFTNAGEFLVGTNSALTGGDCSLYVNGSIQSVYGNATLAANSAQGYVQHNLYYGGSPAADRIRNTGYGSRWAFDLSAGWLAYSTSTNTTAQGTAALSERFRIDQPGNFLLGTTTTLGKLAVGLTPTTNAITDLANFPTSSRVILGDVAGVSTTNSQVFFGAGFSSGGNGINSGIGFLREASGNWGTSLLFYTHPTSTANEDQLVEVGRFTSGGQFLVGTTTTSGGEIARFQTASGSTNIGIIASTSGSSFVNFGDTSDANVGFIGYDHTSNYMNFRTNGAEAMRINSSQALIVGGTSAANSAVITATKGGGVMGMSAYTGSNNGTINTIASATGSGGGLIIVSGVSFGSGQSFSRLYLAGVKVAGGAASVFTTTIASVGEAGVSFTFADSGGYVAATAAGLPNGTWTVMWINT